MQIDKPQDLDFAVVHAVAIIFLTDHIYVSSTRGQPEEHFCTFLGVALGQFIFAQYIIMLLLSVGIYVTVFMNRPLYYGKKDWILIACMILMPLSIIILGAILGWVNGQSPFGFEKYWCIFNISVVLGRVMYIIAGSLAFIVLCITLFTSLSVFRRIKEIRDALPKPQAVSQADADESNSATVIRAQTLQMIQEMILGYLFAMMITLSPIMVHAVVIGIFINEPWWLTALCTAAVNSCGWLNAFVYWRQYSLAKQRNEGGSSGPRSNGSNGTNGSGLYRQTMSQTGQQLLRNGVGDPWAVTESVTSVGSSSPGSSPSRN
ncbi:hypothetical protein HK102_000599 [Quaeritorhiza haematococci]|nr:hypothetical protein HK102_000599 [Quaeritorhiza haematococci]